MSPKLRASIHRILFATSAFAATVAYAEPQQTETSEIAEIVIVTGSYIKGTAEDAALPVDVVTSEDLAKQGSPTMVDLIKSIPAVQGVLGESNQFTSLQAAGTGSVNLRGLGSTRTLVLMNGRRLASAPTIYGVDTNMIPAAAIGRVEVLKDGAAATYGSDAIGGVVNFITKEDFVGLSLDGSYSYIDDSDGDYAANVAWGWEAGSSHGLVAAGYRHRSELRASDRDWAVRDYASNPQGGWSLAGTGTYLAGAGFATRIQDPACQNLGGLIESNACRFQYTTFDNLVEQEDHYQVFADYHLDINDSFEFFAEGFWGMHDVPHEAASPSFGPNQNATGPTVASPTPSPSYFVPLANPGLQAMLPYLSTTDRAVVTGTGGVVLNGLLWRPFATGGYPGNDLGLENKRKFDAFRVSTGVNGEIGPVSLTTAATYMENSSEISTPDLLVARLGRALSGLGGANCTGTTAGANGCEWLNPFSTGVAYNPATGAPNTVSYTPGLEPSAALADWLTTPNSYEAKTTLAVFDVVLSGESGISLPGGAMGWAAGAQYREDTYKLDVTDDFANSLITPCPQTVITSTATCLGTPGALSFFGPTTPVDVSRDMYAVFGELSLPVTDSFQAQLAVRFEDYGGGVGSTTNPKLSLRWQALDWLALRASAGTTFRAPTPASLEPGTTTTLAYRFGSYRPTDTYNNPNLKPETADTYNVGFVVRAGGFSATVDYWNFTFQDQLTTESATSMIQTFFGDGTAAQDHCGEAAYAALESRFTFNGSGCLGANLLRTEVNLVNAGYDVEISGVDASMAYQFENVLGGDLTLGFDGTYNLGYKLGADFVEGVQVTNASDAIGTRGGPAGTLPEWKGAGYINLNAGMHNVRWTARYISGLEDLRGVDVFGTNRAGKNIDGWLTHDLVWQISLPAEVTVNASVFNVFDEDPSFARLDLNYETFLANPLGRYFKIGASKRF